MSQKFSQKPHTQIALVDNDEKVRWDRYTYVEQGSDLWHKKRSARKTDGSIQATVGSSEAGAVFPKGISKTVQGKQLRDKWRGDKTDVTDPYLLDLFAKGTAWEPVLRNELADLLGSVIIEPGIFEGEMVHGVELKASLDGIMRTKDGKLCVVEIKFRNYAGDVGWADEVKGERRPMGLTVFCQVQHQMRVSGIHAGLVWAGNIHGNRRLWTVRYCPEYHLMWDQYLKFFIDGGRYKRGMKKQVKVYLEMYRRQSSSEVYFE